MDQVQLSNLQKVLEDKKTQVVAAIAQKHSDSLDWLKKNGLDIQEMKEHQVKRLAAATATGILMLTPGSMISGSPDETVQARSLEKDSVDLAGVENPGVFLANTLKEKMATKDEASVESFVEANFGVKGKYELEGKRLNVNVGLIGAEQHLYRWAGDTVEAHLENDSDRQMFGRSGIAPNRGAYGYFGTSGEKLARDRERYYFAIQTFLSPTWSTDLKGTYNFFRFRKLIAINTTTGEAVVGVVGDAGPAQWTGKSYGGSPEVMHYLGLGKGPRKGEILLLIVEDQENKIPLGPVKIGQGSA
jgi:TolB-like protein